jgi:putative ABC transport system substrate-binding protein
MVIFLRALRDLGWIEGRNLLVEWRWADGKVERLSGFATELAKLNVDLIVGLCPGCQARDSRRAILSRMGSLRAWLGAEAM